MRALLIASVAAAAALVSSPAAADDLGCPSKLTPELLASLGDPVAWLAPGQIVHAPTGMTVVGQAVSYVIAMHTGADAATPISELHYRIQGMTRPYGSRYAPDLRKAFDKGFSGAACGSAQGSCVIDYKPNADGDFAGAELSEGDIAIPKEAHGDGLAPVKADYNLDGADPVFLVCRYQAPK